MCKLQVYEITFDCPALAGAFVSVLLAYFVEVGEMCRLGRTWVLDVDLCWNVDLALNLMWLDFGQDIWPL